MPCAFGDEGGKLVAGGPCPEFSYSFLKSKDRQRKGQQLVRA